MTTIQIESASCWFGNLVAVNNVTMRIGPGITGLLGPNGAGKTTLITMMSGFLAPSTGTVTLDGEPTWHNEKIYRRIGIVPDQEGLFDQISGWDLVLTNAKLQRLADPAAATRRALELVSMTQAQDRAVSTYSKGMKQRVKMATALVHDPPVLLLDEPFSGMDPRQRLQLMELLRSLAGQGRTIVFSSHILEEVEQLASHIEVVVAGRHAATGDFREIRRLMTDRPHTYLVRSSDDRRLASLLIADPAAAAVELDAAERALWVQAVDFLRFTHALPNLARDANIRLFEVSPADESLDSVFSYLISG